MLYYKFNNYEEFQELFGLQEHASGEKTRKNKILLAFVKNKDLLHEAVAYNDYSLLHISDMAELKQKIFEKVEESGLSNPDLSYPMKLIDYTFYAEYYQTDEYEGRCTDGDTRAIRYISHRNDDPAAYKMKSGKMIRSLILETEFGQKLPEQVLIYLQEEFARDWQVFASRALPEHKLYVNDDFERIYNSEYYAENSMHSCMVDEEGLYTFYEDAVRAKAAYLENEEGDIVARCVIFTDVHEEGSDKIWRLAERQYAVGCSDLLKRALVDALIRGGHIDGYKQIGAGCGDSRAFVDNDGNSLSDKKFYIDCELGTEDPLSYQDSFKYYNYHSGIAYNHTECTYHYELDSTEGSIDGRCSYDDYHEEYCYETTTVFYHGNSLECDSERLDDFFYLEYLDEYHHYEDVELCDDTGERKLINDCYYSDITELYYSCESTRDEAELEYKKRHWRYAAFDDEYYENNSDVTSFWRWNKEDECYEETTIYVGTLINLVRNGILHVFDGEIYNMLCHGKPMDFAA